MRSSVTLASVLMAVASCARAEAPSPSLSAHDVSVLFPLPTFEDDAPLLGVASAGEQGPLMPQWAIDALPPLAAPGDADWAWTQLRAVSVRMDPCFAAAELSASCKNQVRIVWQPVSDDQKEPGTIAMDAAVHTAYDVTREELVNLVRVLRSASGNPEAGELSVHPALLREGMKGAFARVLQSEILRVAGEKRLKRITFMTLPVAEHEWIFGGFDVVGGNAVPLKPAGVHENTQTVRGSATNPRSISARVEPAPPADDPSPLLSQTAASVSPDVAARAFAAATRLENPRLTTAETADCASCHLAGAARRLGEMRFGLGGDARTYSDAYAGGLAHVQGPAQSFRAFGYFGREPSVSARTANETSEVIRLLSELGLP